MSFATIETSRTTELATRNVSGRTHQDFLRCFFVARR